MVPAQTPLVRTAANPKTRFTGIFVPHGAAPGWWVPEAGGPGEPKSQPGSKNFKYPMILEPLEPFRDRTLILSGLWSKSAEPPPGQTGADHWVAAAFLCANKPKKTAGADIYDGTTIDQIIAQKIGQETLLPSLQLALEDPGANSSNCGEGYSCTYSNTISWATPTQPLPMDCSLAWNARHTSAAAAACPPLGPCSPRRCCWRGRWGRPWRSAVVSSSCRLSSS